MKGSYKMFEKYFCSVLTKFSIKLSKAIYESVYALGLYMNDMTCYQYGSVKTTKGNQTNRVIGWRPQSG